VKNIPFQRSKPPVSESAMVSLGWESLQSRRLHSRLTMMYKITNGLVEVSQEYHPVPRPQNSSRGHPRQFQRFQPKVDAFKYAFLPRTIPAWNALPQAVAEADSLAIFKRHMSRHLQFWPSASCTMYIVCTWSTSVLFRFQSTHLLSPLLITVAKIPPVAYYPSSTLLLTYPDPVLRLGSV